MTILAASDFRAALEASGERITVSGNTPFLIDGADRVWIVETGHVDLFAVRLDNGQPVGSRRHFDTQYPGDLIFGMDFTQVGAGQGMLAVGGNGTQLLCVPLHAVRRLAQDPSIGASMDEAVNRWVDGLSSGLARGVHPMPRADIKLTAGQSVELAAGQRVHAEKTLVWVRNTQGQMALLGSEPIPDGGSFVFPVSFHVLVEAGEATQLASCSTREAIAHDDGWRGLTAFYRAMFACDARNASAAVAHELERLQQKRERDQKARAHAINELVSVLEPERRGFSLVDTADPLLAAAALVGSRMGIHVQAAPVLENAKGVDPLVEIARASRFRVRRVILKGQWWTHETTPLLAYREADGAPVALLPSGFGNFEMHDPREQSISRVTKQTAETLKPMAFQFYRPFPDQLRQAGEVLKFGMDGAKGDLTRPLIYGLTAGLLALLTPHITGRIVDRIIPEAAGSELLQMVSILAAVGFASAMLDVARRLGLLRLETKMSAAVAPAMWDRLMALPVSFFRRYNAGDLAQRVGGVDRIRQALSGATTTTLMLSLFSLLYLAQMFYYSWQLALLALGMVAVVLLVTGYCARLKLQVTREVVHVEGRISGLLLQLLTGIPKLRVAAAESRAFAEWARAFSHQKRLHNRGEMADVTINTFNSMFNVATSITVFALMWGLTKDAIDAGEVPLSIGDFVAFNAAFAIMLAQTLQMGLGMMTVMSVLPLFERSRPILEAIPEVDPTKADPGELTGHIEVSHVSFRYAPDGPLILDDVSIEIPAGKFVALVGPSGCGKSTLLRLMLGLETAESGAIYYDGRDVAHIDVQRLRRKIGVVVQNGKIRQGSIYENIVGSQPLSQDDAWEAARMAGLEEDISRMAMGMHTVLQQGGSQLSGGQRQRLMIARAIVNRPRMIFLDEATSALDNRTQAIVAESMDKMEATRVAIAHRLSTIVNADKIIVMAAGKVVQQGTYKELASQEGMFQDLVRRQIA